MAYSACTTYQRILIWWYVPTDWSEIEMPILSLWAYWLEVHT